MNKFLAWLRGKPSVSKFPHVKEKPKNSRAKEGMVVFMEYSKAENVTFSEFYSVQVCPSCNHILNDQKARYETKCCYICGYTNDSVLFSTEKVVVRNMYVRGILHSIVAKSSNHE